MEYAVRSVDKYKNKNVVNPKNWFRKNNKVTYLDDYQKKIIKSNDVQLLGSFSWVQGIDELDSSKFVFLENSDEEYGYFLKLYKKRFMHIDLKAYLGIVNDLQLESTKKYRNEYDPLIKKNIVNSNDIFEYILRRVDRTYDGIYDIVSKLDVLSLEKKRQLTIPLIKEIL